MNTTRIFWLFPILFGLAHTFSAAKTEDIQHRGAQLAEKTLFPILDRYVGTWEGTLKIKAPNNKTLQTIDLQQQYWWENIDGIRILKGQTVLSNQGSLSFVHSRSFIYQGNLYSVSEQDGNEQYNRAIIDREAGEIRWVPLTEQKLRRETIEKFAQNRRGVFIYITGMEDYPTPEGVVSLSMSGALKKTAPQE